VANLRAAVRAMPKQYDGAGFQMATQCRITSLPSVPRKQIAILLAIRQIVAISETSPRAPGLLSVTESVALPPHQQGGHMSDTLKFDLRDWLVPPVLLPIFFALLIAAAVIIQW